MQNVRLGLMGVGRIGAMHARNIVERFDQASRGEMAAFVELVLDLRENPCTPEDAVAASRIADAAQESLETGLPVRVIRSPVFLD